MRSALAALAGLAVLCACGAEAPPRPPVPQPAAQDSGITLSGTLAMGIARTPGR